MHTIKSVAPTEFGVVVNTEGFTKKELDDLAARIRARANRYCRVLDGTAIPVVEDRNGRAN